MNRQPQGLLAVAQTSQVHAGSTQLLLKGSWVCCVQVFVGSALESSDAGVGAIKAWAVEKLPEGPTLYPKVGRFGGQQQDLQEL